MRVDAGMGNVGKILVGIGLSIAALGGLLVAVDRIPGLGNAFSWLGQLPGDISIKRDNVSFYLPIATSIVLSVLLSLLFYLAGWFFRR
jgi:hypothetical protein